MAAVAALLKAYPQITSLVVWFRQGGTPWMEVKVAEMPPAWQREYEAEIARTLFAEIEERIRLHSRSGHESGRKQVRRTSVAALG